MSKVDLTRIRREMYESAPVHKLQQFLLDVTEELALARQVVEAATCPNITYEYPAPCERCLTCEALAAYRAKVGGTGGDK